MVLKKRLANSFYEKKDGGIRMAVNKVHSVNMFVESGKSFWRPKQAKERNFNVLQIHIICKFVWEFTPKMFGVDFLCVSVIV